MSCGRKQTGIDYVRLKNYFNWELRVIKSALKSGSDVYTEACIINFNTISESIFIVCGVRRVF